MAAGEGLLMIGLLFGVFCLALAFAGVVQAALTLAEGKVFHVEQ